MDLVGVFPIDLMIAMHSCPTKSFIYARGNNLKLPEDLTQLQREVKCFNFESCTFQEVMPLTIGVVKASNSEASITFGQSFELMDCSCRAAAGGLRVCDDHSCPLLKLLENMISALDFSSLQLRGHVPKCLGVLHENLTSLSLASNRLVGEPPAELGRLTKLRMLDLSFNRLDGPFPHFIHTLTSLKVMALRNNQLTGTIPENIIALRCAETLDFRNNAFYGEVPVVLGVMATKTDIDLRGNNRGGFELSLSAKALEASLCKIADIRCVRFLCTKIPLRDPTRAIAFFMGCNYEFEITTFEDVMFTQTYRKKNDMTIHNGKSDETSFVVRVVLPVYRDTQSGKPRLEPEFQPYAEWAKREKSQGEAALCQVEFEKKREQFKAEDAEVEHILEDIGRRGVRNEELARKLGRGRRGQKAIRPNGLHT